jgi:O-antigen ligase
MLVTPYEIWNNLYSLAALLVFLLLLYVGAMRRRSLRPDVASIGPWAVCFACLVVFAFLISSDRDLSYRFLFFHLTGMLCVLLCVSAVRSVGEYVRLAGFAASGVFAASVYGVVQRLRGIEVNPSYVDLTVNAGMPGRVFSVFENPNTFAEVLVMLLPVTAGLFFAARTRLGKTAAAVSFLAGTAALGMTYSRASWIGFVAAGAVFVFLMNRRLVPWFVLLGLFALPLLPQTIINRLLTIFNSADSSTASRVPIYEAALRLIRDHTLFGVGLGSDTVRQAVTDGSYYYGKAPFVHCHNIYLQIWAETGLIGLLAFLGSMASAVKSGAKAVLSPETPAALRALSAGCVSGIAGILICCLADYVWMYPRVMVLFWFLFALALTGAKLARAACPVNPSDR